MPKKMSKKKAPTQISDDGSSTFARRSYGGLQPSAHLTDSHRNATISLYVISVTNLVLVRTVLRSSATSRSACIATLSAKVLTFDGFSCMSGVGCAGASGIGPSGRPGSSRREVAGSSHVRGQFSRDVHQSICLPSPHRLSSRDVYASICLDCDSGMSDTRKTRMSRC